MLGLALVFVLYTYGGWNDAAFVVAELQESRRIVPALILGTLSVTAIYLIVNSAYLAALGFDGVRQSNAVAADVLDHAVGEAGSQIISALVMISRFGAANGLIYTGSRLYATFGADYSIFAALGRWHPRWGSPVFALAAQAVITPADDLCGRNRRGTRVVERAFHIAWHGRRPMEVGGQGRIRLAVGSFGAGLLGVFYAHKSCADSGCGPWTPRRRGRFVAPLYPELPLVFTAACGYMLYSAIDFAGRLGLVGAALLAIGLPLYFMSPRTAAAQQA